MLFHKCYLLLLVVCCCVLLQALPTAKKSSVTEGKPMSPSHSRDKRSSDNECMLQDDQSVPVGEAVTRLVNNNYSSLITSLDLCFVISGVNTMPSSDRWVQHFAADIDEQFKAAEIGVEAGNRNRFCVIHFGAKNEPDKPKSIEVNGHVFFSSDEIGNTRSALKSNGYFGDGYKALEYAINNIPFRDDQHVAKSIILFSDTGRSVLADNVGLTKPLLLSLLDHSNITLDVVTNLTTPYSNNTLGFLDYHTIVSDNNEHTHINRTNGEIAITGSHGDSLSSYADLAFQMGGGAWLMEIMYSKGVKSYRDRVTQLAKAYVDSRRYLKNNTCQVCSCGEGSVLSCSVPRNQQSCLTCLDQENCEPSTSGLPLIVSTRMSQPAKDIVNITFHSNREDVRYECTVLDSSNSTATEYCVSPVVLTGLSSGKYKFLIVGSTLDKLSISSEVIHFNIASQGNTALSIEITNKIMLEDGKSVSVSFNTVSPYKDSHVTVMCRIGEEQFTLCTSPVVIQRSSIFKGWVRSLTFIATDEFGGFVLKQENIHFTGENAVQFEKGNIDSNGTVSVLLYSSNTPNYCYCSWETGHILCTPQSDGQPFNLEFSPTTDSPEQLTIKASCYYSIFNSYEITYDNIVVNLQSSPPQDNINCSLRIGGPYTNNTITANFQCNDESVTTSCTVDSHPSHNCFSGYSFNIQHLLPGYHIFTLTAVNPLSGSKHTHIEPFFVNTSVNYECQPLILVDDSVITTDGKTVTLSLSTATGTCTNRDEFSYEINWEDGSTYNGVTAGHVTPLSFIRTYSFSGHYTASVDYCSNSCRNLTRCCSSVDLPLQIN